MTSAKPLSEIIDPSWARALAPVEPTVHEIGERLRQEVASGVGYLPAGTDVLRAFTYPMDDVRVLIVGDSGVPSRLVLNLTRDESFENPRNMIGNHILRPCLVHKNFQDFLSHRILQHIHKVLNIDKQDS